MDRTIRVMHLLGEEADFQTERSARALRGQLGVGFEVLTRSIGPATGALAERGDRNLLSAVLGIRRQRAFDIVHAWDMTALNAAALGGVNRLIFSPSRFLRRREVAWLRAIMSVRDVQVFCSTATGRRTCVEQGVDPTRCHLLRPGVDFSRARGRRDPALRARLGLAEQDVVVLPAGESTLPAAHDQGVWAVSILHALSPDWKVLLLGRGPNAPRVVHLGRNLGQPALMRVAHEILGRQSQFEDLLPAADLVMVSASGPVATLPIAICMAAAVPIISTVTYTTAELLEDRHTAVMCAKDKPRLLAQKALDLREDTKLQASIRDRARAEAYELFPQSRFLAQFRAAYQQIAEGLKVELPA